MLKKFSREKPVSHDTNRGSELVNSPIWPLPPVVLILFVLAGIALNWLFPSGPALSSVPRENVVVGLVISACAFGIATLAARAMARAGTEMRAGRSASALVSSSVFSRSRNPIYLSFVLLVLGIGIATQNPWMVLLAPCLLFYLQERVIKREEAYLQQRFGEEYLAYRRKVRRWF
jgi:protein-S-isoprenylcysteine O-methyltransferase Ste14